MAVCSLAWENINYYLLVVNHALITDCIALEDFEKYSSTRYSISTSEFQQIMIVNSNEGH